MSYVLQQKHHTYVNYDVNRLANVCLDNSGDMPSRQIEDLKEQTAENELVAPTCHGEPVVSSVWMSW